MTFVTDFSDLLDFFEAGQVNIKMQSAGSEDPDTGDWIAGGTTPGTTKAAIAPAIPNSTGTGILASFDPNFDQGGVFEPGDYIVFMPANPVDTATQTALNVTPKDGETEALIFVIDGEDYGLVNVYPFQEAGKVIWGIARKHEAVS